MVQGWVPDSLWAAAIAAAALAAAVLLNILLKLYGKKILQAKGIPAPKQSVFGNAAVPSGQEPERGRGADQEFDLLELAEELENRFAEEFRQKGIDFRMEFPELAVTRAAGDRESLCRVLELLFAEAEDGKTAQVRVLFREMNRDARRLDLMVRVRRIGGGMEADPAVMEAERLVREMGGQLAVSRNPAGGSDFSVFVTLKR